MRNETQVDKSQADESQEARRLFSGFNIDWRELKEDVFHLFFFWLVVSSACSCAAIMCIDDEGKTSEYIQYLFALFFLSFLAVYGIYGAKHYRDKQ